jgi:hypothetical protein
VKASSALESLEILENSWYSNSGWRVNVQQRKYFAAFCAVKQLQLDTPYSLRTRGRSQSTATILESWGMTEEDSSSNYRREEDRNSKFS